MGGLLSPPRWLITPCTAKTAVDLDDSLKSKGTPKELVSGVGGAKGEKKAGGRYCQTLLIAERALTLA